MRRERNQRLAIEIERHMGHETARLVKPVNRSSPARVPVRLVRVSKIHILGVEFC